jgi:threonine aldolase
MAHSLAGRLRRDAKIDIVFPVEANAVFVRLADSLVDSLHARGWHFYKFVEPDVYRLMCSWATSEANIDQLITDLLR